MNTSAFPGRRRRYHSYAGSHHAHLEDDDEEDERDEAAFLRDGLPAPAVLPAAAEPPRSRRRSSASSRPDTPPPPPSSTSSSRRRRHTSSGSCSGGGGTLPLGRRCSLFLLVFLLGVGVAMLGLLLSNAVHRYQKRQQLLNHSPLPDMSYITVREDGPVAPNRDLEEPPPPPVPGHLRYPGGEDEEADEAACQEAMSSVQAAVNSQRRRQHQRAAKLFRHALALCPRHPKILNHYGEFLASNASTADDDAVQADHLFVRAMSFAPEQDEQHVRALQNRQRTAVLVEEIDQRKLSRIDDKKKAFQQGQHKHSSTLKKAKAEAYVQHIYHTVGIEGSTMSLAQTRSLLETNMVVAGKSIQEHNEVLGLDAALKYLNQTLVDRTGEITLDDILQIHRRVIGFVDPMQAGRTRKTQVFVSNHVPPQPEHVDVLLQRFVAWLNEPDNLLEMHPVRLAALAHYKLVYIHPFVDGNGRTARLLMNLILMQAGYPPVIIRKQDRLDYYDHLVTANEGDIRPFVRFIADCTERTLDAYLSWTHERSPAAAPAHGHGAHPHAGGPGLPQFGDDDESVIRVQQEHLDRHDKIIMGGMVGENIAVEP